MKRVLFVCMGNICRSPAAEGVFKTLVKREHLDHLIDVDSAGTLDYHVGELPDARMRRSAKGRGYILDSTARHFTRADFSRFDYIVVMDHDNFQNVMLHAKSDADRAKVMMMTSFCTRHTDEVVPDPYYGGDDGFNHVLDLLEDASEGLLNKVRSELSQ